MDTKKLRQKILDLAIHGKLVPQDPNDEPASVLLERIRAEKEHLMAEGKIKRSRKTAKTTDTHHYEQDVPFEVPAGWELIALEEIFILNPKNEVDDETLAGFIPMALVDDGFCGSHSFEQELWKNIKKGFSHFQNGDIGIAKISPCFENMKSVIFNNLPNGLGAGTTELTILRGRLINVKFYLYLFKTSWYISQGTKYFKGVVGQQRVNKAIFTTLEVPLPPLAEQHRIVAQIERWFTLVDIIEQGKEDLETSIKQVKIKILDLAIHGKLVPQDPNDKSALELLKRINPKAQITCDNGHYPHLPKEWAITSMQQVCSLLDGEKQDNRPMTNIDVKFLRGNSSGKVIKAGKYVSANTYMILVDGENSGEVFKAPIDGYQGSTFKQLSINENMNAEYLLYIIILHRKRLRENKVGSAIPHLDKKLFKAIQVPIPPYKEQVRIVEAINSTFNILDTIKENL